MLAAVRSREVEVSLAFKTTCACPYYKPWLPLYAAHAIRQVPSIICRHASHDGRSKSEKNHYESLGVGQQATAGEIKAAYYALSKVYHPDLSREDLNAGVRFRQITAAYEMLSNPLTRKQYDREMGFGRQQTIAANAATRRRIIDRQRYAPPSSPDSMDANRDAGAQQYARTGDEWRQRAEDARKKHEAETQSRGFAVENKYENYDTFLQEKVYSAASSRTADSSAFAANADRERREASAAMNVSNAVLVLVFGLLGLSYFLHDSNYSVGGQHHVEVPEHIRKKITGEPKK